MAPLRHNGWMTKPAPVLKRATVTCGPLVAGGDALVRRQGEKTMFVAGGIPGETVEVEIYEDRKDLIRARVVAVLDRSSDRVAEPSSEKEAGSNPWAHIAPEAQHRYKVDIVRDALTRIAKLPDANITFASAVKPTGYRTTVRMPVVNGRAGQHVRQSSEVVPLDSYDVAHPLLEELIVDGRFGDADEVRLRVGVSSNERMAWVIGGKEDVQLPDDVTITRNGRKAFVHEDVLGKSFRLSARAFFQSGPEAANLLTKTVAARVPTETKLILDAYAGVGVLGGVIAKQTGALLVAIEQDGASINDAKENLTDIDARIILGEVAAIRPGDTELPDVIIADPARSGLGPSASHALAALNANTFILVSCDPASLARDIGLLSAHAYQLESVEVLDLFPQTHHVETVSVFRR